MYGICVLFGTYVSYVFVVLSNVFDLGRSVETLVHIHSLLLRYCPPRVAVCYFANIELASYHPLMDSISDCFFCRVLHY